MNIQYSISSFSSVSDRIIHVLDFELGLRFSVPSTGYEEEEKKERKNSQSEEIRGLVSYSYSILGVESQMTLCKVGVDTYIQTARKTFALFFITLMIIITRT